MRHEHGPKNYQCRWISKDQDGWIWDDNINLHSHE